MRVHLYRARKEIKYYLAFAHPHLAEQFLPFSQFVEVQSIILGNLYDREIDLTKYERYRQLQFSVSGHIQADFGSKI